MNQVIARVLHFFGIRPNLNLVLGSFNKIVSDLERVAQQEALAIEKRTQKILNLNQKNATSSAAVTQATTVKINISALLGG